MAKIDACIYGRKIKRVFESRLKEVRERFDIKMIDVEILLYFFENKGKSASDLHRELGLNKGQVSTAIDSLCKQNMLVEYENPEDRRYLKYELTDDGKQVVATIQTEICDVYKIITNGLNQEEQQTFFHIGKTICQNIDKNFND